MSAHILLGLAGVALHGIAAAQQFQLQPNAFPGAATWTDGVEAADVDRDGDLDVFFAEGEGFSPPGTPLQHRLWINQSVGGTPTFSDESVARLGAHASLAKQVVTGDLRGTGWPDVLFTSLSSAPPSLYFNRGGLQPGYFDFVGAQGGLTEALDSYGGQFADLDDDGDLDLVITNSPLLGFGRPRLYLNDGAGVFVAQSTAAWNPIPKRGQMDVQVADLDLDWDLDVLIATFGPNVEPRQYLLLNDGHAAFTDASALLPTTSATTFEMEASDLDGDPDIDLFVLGLGDGAFSFANGPVLNQLVPSGTLNFQEGVSSGSVDINEIALLDRDMDGDLDPTVATLSAPAELFYRNDGAGVFTLETGLITPVDDPSLDCTFADFDLDGDYDLVTVQGEEDGPTAWEKKLYWNQGPTDDRAPRVVREAQPANPTQQGPWIVRAEVRDEVMDDGRDWVSGATAYVVLRAPIALAVTITASGFAPSAAVIAPGTRVLWTNADTVPHTIVSSTSPYTYASAMLVPGATFERTFVGPDLYTYSSPLNDVGPASLTVLGEFESDTGLPIGGGLHRFELEDVLEAFGTLLAYELRFEDGVGNSTVTEPRSVPLNEICGATTYGLNLGGANLLSLAGAGSTALGGQFQTAIGSVPGPQAWVAASLQSSLVPLFGGSLLVDPGVVFAIQSGLATSGSATVNWPIPMDPSLAGLEVYFQAISTAPLQPLGWTLSNGLRLRICN